MPVSRAAVGDYVCRAVNTEGTGESNAVPLKIMCKLSKDSVPVPTGKGWLKMWSPGCVNTAGKARQKW